MVLDVTKVCSSSGASPVSMRMDFGCVSGLANEGQGTNSAPEQETTSPLFDEMLQVAEILDYAFVHYTAHKKGWRRHFKIWRGQEKELFLLKNMFDWFNDFITYVPEYNDYPHLINTDGFQDEDLSRYEMLEPCERLHAINENRKVFTGLAWRYRLRDINRYIRAVDYTMPHVTCEYEGLNLFLFCNVINGLQGLMPYVDETASLTVKNKPVAPWQKYLNTLAEDMNESLHLISEIYELPADLTAKLKAHTLTQNPIDTLAVWDAWKKTRQYKNSRKVAARKSRRGRDV